MYRSNLRCSWYGVILHGPRQLCDIAENDGRLVVALYESLLVWHDFSAEDVFKLQDEREFSR